MSQSNYLGDSLSVLIDDAVNRKGGASNHAILEVQAYTDMETKLAGAPLVLAVLGTLGAISVSGPDFSLVDEEEKAEFKLLKHPTSFRASLTQVANEVYNTLLTSHNNMESIKVMMIQIPAQMLDAVDILRKGSDSDIKNHLPTELKLLDDINKKAQDKVTQVLDKFTFTIDTLHELVTATEWAKGTAEHSKDKAEIELKVIAAEKEQYEAQLKEMESELAKVMKKVVEEEQAFKSELKKLGSSKMFFKETLASVADVAIGGVNSVLGTSFNAGKGGSNSPNGAAENQPGNIKDIQVAKFIEQVTNSALQPLLDYFGQDQILDFVKLKDLSILSESKTRIQRIGSKLKPLQGVTPGVYKEATNFLIDIESFIEELENAAKKGEAKENMDMHEWLNELLSKASEIGVTMSAVYGVPLHGTPGPNQINSANQDMEGGSSSLRGSLVKAQYTKLELTRQQYRYMEEKAEALRQKKLEKNKELNDVLREIIQLEAEKMTQQDILKIIVHGLKQLYRLREEWTKMFMYFNQISILIKDALGPSMTGFNMLVEGEAKQKLENEAMEMSGVIKDNMFKKISKVVITSRVVKFLSSSYTELSNNHLMPMIHEFGQVMALSRDQAEEITMKKEKLARMADEAQKSINDIILNQHEKFQQDLKERTLAVESAYNEQLEMQTLTEKEKKAIQEDSKKKFEKVQRKLHATTENDFY